MAVTGLTLGGATSWGLVGGILALLMAALFAYQVVNYPCNDKKMLEVSDAVHAGAKAFLHTEYKYLTVFCIVVGIAVLAVNPEPGTDGLYTMLCFFWGAILSGLAGYFGMLIATKANVRTTEACKDSTPGTADPAALKRGLSVAFKSGAVMALTVVGSGIVGLSILVLILQDEANKWQHISGFGFGASSIALFARVGGGVFTKAADVGADLVGKVESGIPEDDPRNPATIADNVGDNVGDVAGMGADLFESYVGSLIAASTLGASQFENDAELAMNAVALPFWIAGFGILASFVGIFFVTNRQLPVDADLEMLLWNIRYGIIVSGLVVVGLSMMCCLMLFSGEGVADGATSVKLFGCILTGLVSGNIIGFFTEYCTSYSYTPTISIAQSSKTGPATVVIRGLGVGMISVVVPTVAIGGAVLACNELQGLYGVSLAAVGMLSTLGITLATDAYGPVADNAGGIAEMVASIPESVRDRTDALDSLGNTTAATGKGFAIGSAVLTSIGLIAAFMEGAGLKNTPVGLEQPVVLTGLLIGASLPFLFAALTMLSVGKSAGAIIEEVRRQFKKAPQLKEEGAEYPIIVDGEELPNSQACVAYCTQAAVQEMLIPGAMSVFAPAVIGCLLGSLGLAGMLAGSLTSGFMLALTMANAGGAWDNAKKLVEKEAADAKRTGTISPYGPKGADRHSAVVTGDTVGDPFKDTSGPALNILIKLMSVVSLVLAPTFKKLNNPEGFGADGVLIAIIVFVLVSAFCLAATYVFNSNKKKSDDDAPAPAGAAESKATE